MTNLKRKDSHMAKRISLMLVAALILVFAVTVAGCGDDKDSSSSSGDSSSQSDSGSKDSGSKDSGSADDTPDNLDEAVDKCLEEADKAPDGDAKDAAKKLCKAAKSQDPEKVKDAAQEACLDLTNQLPAGAQRDQAEQACKDGTK